MSAGGRRWRCHGCEGASGREGDAGSGGGRKDDRKRASQKAVGKRGCTDRPARVIGDEVGSGGVERGAYRCFERVARWRDQRAGRRVGALSSDRGAVGVVSVSDGFACRLGNGECWWSPRGPGSFGVRERQPGRAEITLRPDGPCEPSVPVVWVQFRKIIEK